MTDFTIHTQETAPAESKPLLDKAQKAYGMIPGLFGVLAEAPQALEAYQTAAEHLAPVADSWSAQRENIARRIYQLTSQPENP